MKQAERYLGEGLHPRVLVEGFEVAKKATLESAPPRRLCPPRPLWVLCSTHTHTCHRPPRSLRLRRSSPAPSSLLTAAIPSLSPPAASPRFLDQFKETIDVNDREKLICVARTALRTKLRQVIADQLTDIVVDAVLCIKKEGASPAARRRAPRPLNPTRSLSRALSARPVAPRLLTAMPWPQGSPSTCTWWS